MVTSQKLNQEQKADRTLEMPKRILLGPGPSMLDPQILNAMATPMIGHLDPKFLELMDETQELLRYTFQTENRLTIPISGTGSAAMEASIANLIEPGDKVLVCINGYFGLRLVDMSKRYGAEVASINKSWGDIFSSVEVEQALRSIKPKVVAIVHAETSTGALQPIEEISALCHRYGALLIVDAVTSLAGVPLMVDEWDIDVCYSGTQKCIGAPPGLGPITFGHRAVEVLHHRQHQVANWYLDMSLVEKYWGAERTYHHTAPISSNYALYSALKIIAKEGLEARWKRHQHHAEKLWSGLEDLNLKCFVPSSYRLPSLTTVAVPEGVDAAAVQRRLLNEYNIEIAGGLGDLKGKIWRIGLMGYSSREEYVNLLLDALEEILKR